jgi:hypothetical protein
MTMNEVLQRHGVQVVGERSWGRQLGEGLFEFRVDRTVKADDEVAEKIATIAALLRALGKRIQLVDDRPSIT